ncbi:MAG: 16S rRNA (cytosine(1402)-N(4))-methyltransferase RsmH [Elainellaceae cyanobacterium]
MTQRIIKTVYAWEDAFDTHLITPLLMHDHPSQSSEPDSFFHIPVLLQEAIAGLALKPGGRYLDATVGGGGHSLEILRSHPDIQLVALDQDQQAIAAAQQRLADYGDRVQFHHCNFSDYHPDADEKFDGILADLGVSSVQFDQAERGFSFRHDAPLDMRMNSQQSLTAAEMINHEDEKQLADLIYTYGEERLSRRIARNIVQARPIQTTKELADVIWKNVPNSYRRGRIHPATRTFQALRIAVNRELDALETLIQHAPDWLNSEGRLVIISFHSLEDRIVKFGFRDHPLLTVITKKPMVPNEQEVRHNPRARSAKLRTAERSPDLEEEPLDER